LIFLSLYFLNPLPFFSSFFIMYQFNNPRNEDSSPIPSTRAPMRPRFNTGEEYGNGSFDSGSYTPLNDHSLGYYESAIPGSQPLLSTPNSGISSPIHEAMRYPMPGGGPDSFGMAPRRQQRRYKTGTEAHQFMLS
jgi:chitin synthase